MYKNKKLSGSGLEETVDIEMKDYFTVFMYYDK